MKMLDQPSYQVGDFEVDPTRMCVRRAGEEYPLRQKSFQVLLYLLEYRARLVTKEELLQNLWDGTAVTNDALVQIIVELRKVFGDDARHPQFIRTVPKIGYHYIAPVSELLPEVEGDVVEIEEVTTVQVEVERTIDTAMARQRDVVMGRPSDPAISKFFPRLSVSLRPRVAVFAALSVIAVLAAGWFVLRRTGESTTTNVTLPRVPGKKPVVVMYFENRAGDRELDWRREGLADMLIASLSRSQRLTLLSRQQLTALLSHTGQQNAVPIKLEGGLEIARRALNPESGVAIIHLGNLRFQQGQYAAAAEQYRRYIQIARDDKQRSRGFSYLAWLYLRQGELAQATAAAKEELKYDPTAGWHSLALALQQGAQTATAKLSEVVFAPANYEVYSERGYLRIWKYQHSFVALRQGRADEAINHFHAALQHRAVEWNIDSFADCLANAYLELGRADEAIAEYERILKINPHYPLAHYHLGQAYERKGEPTKARAAYQRFLTVWRDADADLPEILAARQWLTVP